MTRRNCFSRLLPES